MVTAAIKLSVDEITRPIGARTFHSFKQKISSRLFEIVAAKNGVASAIQNSSRQCTCNSRSANEEASPLALEKCSADEIESCASHGQYCQVCRTTSRSNKPGDSVESSLAGLENVKAEKSDTKAFDANSDEEDT